MKVNTCLNQMLEREVDNQNESGISMKSPLTEICWHNLQPSSSKPVVLNVGYIYSWERSLLSND